MRYICFSVRQQEYPRQAIPTTVNGSFRLASAGGRGAGRLVRRQHPARNARPRLIGAVELAYRVAALDIACQRYGQMEPADPVMGFFGKTRVRLDERLC